MPITNQISNRLQVGQESEAISAIADNAPAGATNQTAGVLNLRGRLGSRIRRTRIPAETITKARRVPIEQRLPASLTVRTAEKKATARPVMMDVIQGVRNRGW